MARTKKIIQADDDIHACSNNAAFAITVATESFIRYISTQAFAAAKSERRSSRHTVTYRDVATAVNKHDNLEFLLDVVPRTITYRQWSDKQGKLRKKKIDELKRKQADANGKDERVNRDLKEMMVRAERGKSPKPLPMDLEGMDLDRNGGELDVDQDGRRVNLGDKTSSDSEESIEEVKSSARKGGRPKKIHVEELMDEDDDD